MPATDISPYDYPLPEERIAKFPLPRREESRLLVCRDGQIGESLFRHIGEALPEGALLVFNNTRVVRSRLLFAKPSGARIEVFCLEPHDPADHERAFAARDSSVWRCLVGNAKRWKEGALGVGFDLEGRSCSLSAVREGEGLIRFEWDAPLTFGQLLEHLGRVPIPPYLGRESEEIDNTRYQTVYSRIEGSVAAPTAGLHFSRELLESLQAEGVATTEVTLHVGAGTFLPVKGDDARTHAMHAEHFEVSLEALEALQSHPGRTVAVGTTTVRTLESLVAIAARILDRGDADSETPIGQWELYDAPEELDGRRTLETLINPGSEQVLATALRDGLIDDLKAIGGVVLANACGPCIGQWERGEKDNLRPNSIVTTYNRNFAKRADGNPNTNIFIVSPQIATALAIAGDLRFNPLTDSLETADGRRVKLDPPKVAALPAGGICIDRSGYVAPSADGHKREVKVDPSSHRIQLLRPFAAFDPADFQNMYLLLQAEGKCTTDHISQAGSWLRFRGHLENISDNLLMGAVNRHCGRTNETLNRITGERGAVSAVAKYYKSKGLHSIVVAEENYGEGSSREHAALEPRFLNVKAVLAKSFARIHETNLKKQGVLAITFADKADYDLIRESDTFSLPAIEQIAPGRELEVVIVHDDGTTERIRARHTYNELQTGWLKAGSALNHKG